MLCFGIDDGMDHRYDGMDQGIFGKLVFHRKRVLTYLANFDSEIVGLSRKERRKKVCLGVANWNDIVLVPKPFFPGVTSGHNKLLESIMSKSEDIPEKHDSSRVCFFKSKRLLSSKNLIHTVPNFTA